MARETETASLEKARRMIAAIDKRINRVRAQLPRVSRKGSAHDWQRAWDAVPGLQGIEKSLFAHRGRYQEIRDNHLWRQARLAERRKARELAAQYAAPAKHCATCVCPALSHPTA